jgi:hypothetical protein
MPKRKPTPSATKRWTVLVYLAGDNDLSTAGEKDVLEMKSVGSTDDVNVVVQFDRAGEGTTTRYLLREGTPLENDAVETLRETNTGDPAVLADFLAWGCRTYPAEHVCAVLWNHGAGWDDTNPYRALGRDVPPLLRKGAIIRKGAGRPVRARQALAALRRTSAALLRPTVLQAMTTRGIAYDDQARDFLDSAELKRVLANAKRASGRSIDVLGFDACLMSMAEVAYQLRGSAELVVGSEESEPNDGWPYDRILAALAAKPSMNPKELSQVVVRAYLASYRASDAVTQSAVDVTALAPVASAVDALGKALAAAAGNETARTRILQARYTAQEYSPPYDVYCDLVDLCSNLGGIMPGTAVAAASADVAAAVRAAVVEHGSKGAAVARSNGLSIYFPTKRLSPLYAKLDFAKKTSWNRFLALLLEGARAAPRVAA